MQRRWIAAALCLALLLPVTGIAEEEDDFEVEEIIEDVLLDDDGVEILENISDKNASEVGAGDKEEEVTRAENPAREDFIDRIIALGKKLYEDADGKRKRAHYASDIYVCKNYTVYLFRQNRDDFRMAEFPNTQLVIPNNLPAAKCKPYAYGFLWEEVSAEKGNPFEVAAQFIYDTNLTKAENLELAKDFMRQAQRGDFFQMSADYEYGVGAHSAIMMSYDPETDEIHWLDSNMRGGKNKDGIRYGMVQYDAVKSVEWWASTFCHKKRGATLYRLRDDIIYAGE